MEKRLIVFLLLIISTVSLAQTIKIAPVIGPNITFGGFSKATRSALKNDLPDLLEGTTIKGRINILPAIRMQVGGLIDYSFNDALSLQSGLLVNLRGYGLRMKFKDNSTGGSNLKYSGKASMSYLELPIWASYQMKQSGLRISIGPSFGVAVGGKAQAVATVDGETESETQKLSIGNEQGLDDIKPFDVSINLGIVKQLSVANQSLEVSLNIQPSFTKWGPTGNSEYYARYFTLGLRAAYFISIK